MDRLAFLLSDGWSIETRETGTGAASGFCTEVMTRQKCVVYSGVGNTPDSSRAALLEAWRADWGEEGEI